jgi:outer membrane protein TolC
MSKTGFAARVVALTMATILVSPCAWAQGPGSRPPTPGGLPEGPFAGGVPTGARTEAPVPLTLGDALDRGLRHNLGVIAREADVEGARGERQRSLAAVLPNVSGTLSASREVVNLAALGFSGFNDLPNIIGPFNVYDARLSVSQPVVDVSGLFHMREAGEQLAAARHTYRNARDLVVLAVTNLYLQSLTADSRVASVQAQVQTADALARLAEDRKQSGLIPAIDVLRAQVQRETERQRLITAQNTAAKQKLALARAIGLPLGQPFALADAMPYLQRDVPTLDAAVQQAYTHREDLLAQESAMKAAEAAGKAAAAERLPSLGVDAAWGPIGQTPGSAIPTYAVATRLHVPLFNSGTARAHAIEAAATLQRRRAELADARAKVYYEVEAALLDLNSARQLVDVAAHTVDLSEQQLVHARDRFGAGVADTIEVVQAQEALAAALDARVASLYGYNAAMASLATSLGLAEEEMPQFLGVSR